ncbi:hypothetical protein CRM22_005929 [Opisthorchis felineus]|uniref:NADP-dependent oxidoreductase domain-containing protein n=1 Tax=Opisthorchis felineus TaxID=147828 RepID=A0A4S2LVZ3_OPIFE|nr:hypothetical protein CRM22_005929 [Opisthorchis felineus]
MTREATELHNGYEIPNLFYGTYKVLDEILPCLDAALGSGYRGIDTAAYFRNERRIGESLKVLLPKYELARDNVFITTKLPPKSYGAAAALSSLKMSLEALQLSYLDLYMIHWPGLQGVLPPGRIRDSRGYMSDLRRLTWQTLETMVILERPKTKVKSDAPTKSDMETSETVIQGSGPYRIVRSLGVCNYLPRHIEELASYATIIPCVIQYEFHPFLSVKAQEHPMRRTCTRLFPMQSVHFQCHTSLANGSRELLTSPIITEAASDLQRTPAQVVLRWALEKGHSVIARSSKPRHIVENSRIFGWDLDAHTVQKIDAMERNERYCWDPHAVL